ncbi:hypothetical protein [Clostridium ganghwense]|uniref:Lipoprotein n=1 Tax=Clostridium ganghwense TaxID=312089 RepID=A0ABT4CUF8_9CLOT|nr:hypothetical protein [Clostridium ganghwense]MCY6372695.1 hypothetical protein [Clostridium ganghwense]
MKRRFSILAILLVSNLTLSACSIKNPFKKNNSETSAKSTEEQTKKDGQKVSIVDDFAEKKKQIENKFMNKRKSLENDRDTKSKKYLAAIDSEISKNDTAQKKVYDDKVSNAFVDYTANLTIEAGAKKSLIDDEYENEKKKIEDEYDAEVERNTIVPQNNLTSNSPEKNKAEKIFKAKKSKAEKEKNLNNKSDARLTDKIISQANLKSTYDNIWKKYNEKLKVARTERDNNKTAFKEKVKKDYDEKFNKLSEEGIMTDTIWLNLILEEDKKITDYSNEQDLQYNNTVDTIIKWRDSTLSNLLK